jgi:hypothetical protein
MAKKKAAKKSSDAAKVGIGIGLTAAAVSAAGAYFLYGSKQAAKNRKKVKSWALKAKGDVLEALEKAEEITEEEYKDLVASAIGAYGSLKNASKGEVKDFQREMAGHWDTLQKSKAIKKISKPIKTKVKKVVRRKAKKATRKKAKKAVKRSPKKTSKKATKKAPKKKATRKK